MGEWAQLPSNLDQRGTNIWGTKIEKVVLGRCLHPRPTQRKFWIRSGRKLRIISWKRAQWWVRLQCRTILEQRDLKPPSKVLPDLNFESWGQPRLDEAQVFEVLSGWQRIIEPTSPIISARLQGRLQDFLFKALQREDSIFSQTLFSPQRQCFWRVKHLRRGWMRGFKKDRPGRCSRETGDQARFRCLRASHSLLSWRKSPCPLRSQS